MRENMLALKDQILSRDRNLSAVSTEFRRFTRKKMS